MIESKGKSGNLIDEVNLKKLIQSMRLQKKIIIICALFFASLTFVYTYLKEPSYLSSVIVEIGHYEISEDVDNLIENVDNLIASLKVELFYKQNVDLRKIKFTPIEGRLVIIDYESKLSKLNENLLKNTFLYVQNRHSGLIAQRADKLIFRIKSIDNKIAFSKNLILKNSLKERENTIAEINLLNIEIPYIRKNILSLENLVIEEQDNLLILSNNLDALLERVTTSPTLQQLIYSYKAEVNDLMFELNNKQLLKEKLELELETKMIAIVENDFSSEKIFSLLQEKRIIEKQLSLLTSQETRLINPTNSIKVSSNIALLTFLGAFFGFIIMTSIIFFREIYPHSK